MRTGLLVVFWLITVCSVAQEYWSRGVVVDDKRMVWTGRLIFRPVLDVVILEQSDHREVFPAWRLQSFRFYDSAVNISRKFIRLVAEKAEPRLFEVIVDGVVQVVRRQKLKGSGIISDRDGYDYYFVRDGRPTLLMRFRTTLYPHIRDEVGEEERASRLNPNSLDDAIRYIKLYNQQRSTLHLTAAR